MTQTAVASEVTLDPGEVAQTVEQVPDQLRAEIVAAREAGSTLAELKRDFGPQVATDVIRELLPPGNARERKAKEAKAPKAKDNPAPKVEAPKPDPKPRYVEDQDLVVSLSERTLACRDAVGGRGKLAELLGVSGSACWRFEHQRIHPDEVESLKAGLAAVEKRIAGAEFVKPERQPQAKAPSKADLLHRVEVATELLKSARGEKSITKTGLVDSLLAVLEPADAPRAS